MKSDRSSKHKEYSPNNKNRLIKNDSHAKGEDATPAFDELLVRVNDLEERERLYRSFAENTSDLFYRTDTFGRITYISRSVYELSGYTVEEAIGMNMAEDVYMVPRERENFLAVLNKNGRVHNFSARLKRKDGSMWWASTNAHFYYDEDGNIMGVEGITRDVTEQKRLQETQMKLIEELKDAMTKVKTLSGLLPICASCKKIRDDKGYWSQIEIYISKHSEAEFSHGICPDCQKKLYTHLDITER